MLRSLFQVEQRLACEAERERGEEEPTADITKLAGYKTDVLNIDVSIRSG
jgi:hypothetical protein